MNNFKEQLLNSAAMPIFEIEAIDAAGESIYILCDISVKDNQLIAQRDAVSKKELQSEYIAKSVIDIDADCFTLDEHLQELHGKVINDILSGGLYIPA